MIHVPSCLVAGGPNVQHSAGVLPVPGAETAIRPRSSPAGALPPSLSVADGCAGRVLKAHSRLQPLRLKANACSCLQAALKATLYGGKQRIDVARLQRLASGFSRFTVDGITAAVPAQVNPPPPPLPPLSFIGLPRTSAVWQQRQQQPARQRSVHPWCLDDFVGGL